MEKDLLEKDTEIIIQSDGAQEMFIDKDTEKTASTLEINANVKIGARRPSLFKRKYDKLKLALKGSDASKTEKRKFLELSLFRNFGFTCLCLQLLLFTLSFNTTFVFLPALAKEKGVPQIKGAYLVSILGIFDAISRIVVSIILDLKQVKKYRLIIYNIVMFVIGGVSICLPSLTEFWQFCVVAGIYGVLSGTYISQKSVVCVDILGVEKLASSFGLLLLFQGVSTFIGPTLGGKICYFRYLSLCYKSVGKCFLPYQKQKSSF